MKGKAALQALCRAPIAEVGLVVSRWTAARAGAIASLWPTNEPRLVRYVAEMMNAQSHTLIAKSRGA